MKRLTIHQAKQAFHHVSPPAIDRALQAKLWHFFRVGFYLGRDGRIPEFDVELCQQVGYQIVPASVIWDRWAKVKHIFGNKCEAWLRLVRIAAAGKKGLAHRELFPNSNGWAALRNPLAAGIIEKIEVRDVLNRRQIRLVITWKGLNFLRLESTDFFVTAAELALSRHPVDQTPAKKKPTKRPKALS